MFEGLFVMGHVYVVVKIGDPLRRRVRSVKMLVDTEATYPCIPVGLAEDLGLKLEFKTRALLADGREIEA